MGLRSSVGSTSECSRSGDVGMGHFELYILFLTNRDTATRNTDEIVSIFSSKRGREFDVKRTNKNGRGSGLRPCLVGGRNGHI